MSKNPAPVIPYHEVKRVIEECKAKRTQALIAFQYAMGNRAGELAKEYKHVVCKMNEYKDMRPVDFFISEGIKRSQFFETELGLEWVSPNFKNKKKTVKRAWIVRDSERWLYDVLKSWLDGWKPTKKNKEVFLFDIRHSRLKGLIDKELKQYDDSWSSHCLRHSRATHIGEITGNIFVVQEVLGHGRIETSKQYISIAKRVLLNALKGKSFEEVLGKKV